MNRIIHFATNILLSGVLLYGLYLLLLYAIYSLLPTTVWFQYHSVEPVHVPVEITKDYILMESVLTVKQKTNLYWNDVLRCRGHNDTFSFYSQYDTNANTMLPLENMVSQWRWRGIMPVTPAICRMDSTITTKLPFGIKKSQFISSQEFLIQ